MFSLLSAKVESDHKSPICSRFYSITAENRSWFFFVWLFICFFLLMATPAAYGSSQARGRIRATAAGLWHSHSHSCWPTPQFMAMPDPQPSEQGLGSNPHLHVYPSDLFPLRHNGNSQELCLIFWFCLFFDCAHGMQKFLGPGSEPVL